MALFLWVCGDSLIARAGAPTARVPAGPAALPPHSLRHLAPRVRPHAPPAVVPVPALDPPRPRLRIRPHRYRRYKVRVYTRKSPVADAGPALVLPVVVGRYRPGTEVGPLPYLRVPYVREVGHLAPPPHPRVLDLAAGGAR